MSAYEAFQAHATEITDRLDRRSRGRMMFLLAAPFLVITLFLAATAGENKSVDAQLDVIAAADKWADEGPASYTVTYAVVTGGETFGPATVTVVDGAVVAVETADPAFEDSRVYTVEAALLAVERIARDPDAEVLAVNYHPELGYVRSARLDPDLTVTGDEWTLHFSDFIVTEVVAGRS
jgi:hypothetical protein